MNYMVIGSDGKEYGPVDANGLKDWVDQGRVSPDTVLRDFSTGQTFVASTMTHLFQTASVPPTVANVIPNPLQQQEADTSSNFPWTAFVYPALAVLMFFVFHGIGLVFAGYGVYHAIQSHTSGNKYGIAAIAWSILGAIAVGIGWFLRSQGKAA